MTEFIQPTKFWWVRQLISVLLSVFFLVFGIEMLIAAFRQTIPFHFIMTFFASNFVILISLAIGLGVGWRMIWTLRKMSEKP